MKKIKFGWIPDTPDKRDHYFSSPIIDQIKQKLPPLVDLRKVTAPIYNQGSLGSCTAQSVAGVLQHTMLETSDVAFLPSRLFIYYNTRVIQKTINQDSGASLRNTIKAVAQSGYPKESLWPHRIQDFKKKPSSAAYNDAQKRKLQSFHYARVPQNLNSLATAIAEGNPIVFGFAVYESFSKVGKNGMMPMPKKGERVNGGHAVAIFGYDANKKVFIVRNSWGKNWGDQGYFYMPFDFALDPDHCADFWVVKGTP